jgi:hypothetical protein
LLALATATERDMLCYLFLPAGLSAYLPVVPAVSTFNFQGLSKKKLSTFKGTVDDFVT